MVAAGSDGRRYGVGLAVAADAVAVWTEVKCCGECWRAEVAWDTAVDGREEFGGAVEEEVILR